MGTTTTTPPACKWEGCEATPGRRSGYCDRHRRLARAQGITNTKVCQEDGCNLPAVARNRCRTHYRKWLEANVRPPCSVEDCDEPTAGKGLCRKHYMRLQRTGSTGDERKNARRSCSVAGCSDRAVSNGLCDKHRLRLRRYGSIDLPVRPVFVPPAGYHCRWCGVELEPQSSGKGAYCSAEHRALQLAADRNTPEAKARRRDLHLQRSYGITSEDYDRMFAAQGGRCGLCGNEGSNTERSAELAVDHDHETGVVRGLLCHDCNTGLGKLGDDPALLRKAADYVERYQAA